MTVQMFGKGTPLEFPQMNCFRHELQQYCGNDMGKSSAHPDLKKKQNLQSSSLLPPEAPMAFCTCKVCC